MGISVKDFLKIRLNGKTWIKYKIIYKKFKRLKYYC